MKIKVLLVFALFALAAAAQAQVYKWVDKNGNVTYSDTPPPSGVTSVEVKPMNDGAPSSDLPFELQQAARKMPVTLYTFTGCGPCDDARNYLKNNGIPFSERTVNSNEDINKFNSISGGTQLPYLSIGSSGMRGYNQSEWRSSLSAAGYPDSNRLPPNYQFSLPRPLAPPAPAAQKTPQPVDTPAPPQPKPADDPNAFKF